MANYEATRYDFDGANLTDIQGLNTGLIIPWTDTSVPSGFLECNGAEVSRTTYSALFAVVGTTYGSGNGSTTFTLPDLSDDVVVGKSPTKALASTGGANTVTTSGNVAGSVGNTSVSTPQIGSHSHNHAGIPAPNPNRNAFTNPRSPIGIGSTGMTMNNTGGGGAHTHPSSINFTGTANSVLQPYVTLLYIIKT
jgi:microcystin-dependent protein